VENLSYDDSYLLEVFSNYICMISNIKRIVVAMSRIIYAWSLIWCRWHVMPCIVTTPLTTVCRDAPLPTAASTEPTGNSRVEYTYDAPATWLRVSAAGASLLFSFASGARNTGDHTGSLRLQHRYCSRLDIWPTHLQLLPWPCPCVATSKEASQD
jgi:hypothetical protein